MQDPDLPDSSSETALRWSAEPILPIVIVPLEAEGEHESDPAVNAPLEPHLQLIEQFLQAKSAGSTQKAYRHQLLKFATYLEASENPLDPTKKRSQPWETVTAEAIRKYILALRQAGQKPTSIKQALSAIQSFYKWLRQQGHYPATQALPTDLIDRRLLDRR